MFHSRHWYIPALALAAVAVLFYGDGATGQQRAKRAERAAAAKLDPTVRANAERLLAEGVQTFRYDTFGSEDFWGGQAKVHQAIQGEKCGAGGAGGGPQQGAAHASSR